MYFVTCISWRVFRTYDLPYVTQWVNYHRTVVYSLRVTGLAVDPSRLCRTVAVVSVNFISNWDPISLLMSMSVCQCSLQRGMIHDVLVDSLVPFPQEGDRARNEFASIYKKRLWNYISSALTMNFSKKENSEEILSLRYQAAVSHILVKSKMHLKENEIRRLHATAILFFCLRYQIDASYLRAAMCYRLCIKLCVS